ncbi:NnrT protein [Celeribacter naphthalenivorans]|uniref:NnrT protein n=1 Tax=Celeribacter naphthalenivorans TaxID=1614694 RepID=UPI001CFBF805|nr:NnrT protein [Celeribacter naphthalenivorans]
MSVTGRQWSATRIAVLLYPFGWGAFAVNVFFASLIGSWVGFPVATTPVALGLGALIAVPATYAFARHIRRLMDQADA